MHFCLFLHIYQPPTQDRKMTKKIAGESYEKIISLLEEFPMAKITLNINASLTQQLYEVGEERLLERMAHLAYGGQIEFTGSAAYHPILPDLPKREISRQINLNTSINQSYFGSAYQPRGFFPPEMAYDYRVGEVVEKHGFEWIIVDGTAVATWEKYLSHIYRSSSGRLLAFPREDELSYRIAFGRVRTMLGLLRFMTDKECRKRQYVIFAMDGETFGHHQPKQLVLLRDLFKANRDDKRVQLTTISELDSLYPKRVQTELLSSTWGYTEFVDGQRVWVRWRNPENPVHSVLNEIRSLALHEVHVEDDTSRELLDKALNSDTYWWSSGKPYWHPGMVYRGAEMFCDAVKYSDSATEKQKRRIRYLCQHTLRQVMNRLRMKKQRERILGGKGRT